LALRLKLPTHDDIKLNYSVNRENKFLITSFDLLNIEQDYVPCRKNITSMSVYPYLRLSM